MSTPKKAKPPSAPVVYNPYGPPQPNDPPDAYDYACTLFNALAFMAYQGTGNEDKLVLRRLPDWADALQVVAAGQWFACVENLKLLAQKSGVRLSAELRGELCAGRVRAGKPLPRADRERLAALVPGVWAEMVRLDPYAQPPADTPAAEEEPNSLGDLLAAAKRARVKGDGLTIIERLCAGNGRVRLTDLAFALEWPEPFDGVWNSARRRLNEKLERHGWKLCRSDSQAVAERTRRGARK